ncbi:PEPxxWA-CTERM sorting domain-containing protein [uncultured Rhodoblastus sp.]|uniref:PEPxxWA-CTERM sorting domain-containing protein n=1 Tax=uncultured Rhodoblastus sp. TaxID=543037 RepID=UPI0025DE0749|nr:PEPxxWA-CTERM sorting domain-containing protein [uncultured Rhodoblastus sp.]
MTRVHLAVAFAALVAGSEAASAAVIDNINGNFLPPFNVFGPPIENIGWTYTPSFSYNLDGVFSYFKAVPNATAGARTVTVVIENTPGGSPIASGTFTVGNGGGAQGATFSPITLTAGQTYFVGFENVGDGTGSNTSGGLGINIVDWYSGVNGQPLNQQPAGTVNLNGWYYGTASGNDFSNFVSQTPFAAPILNFYGTPISTGAVPEPSTWAMMLLGFAGLGLAGYRRQRKTDAVADAA